jgi:hypothetical protein
MEYYMGGGFFGEDPLAARSLDENFCKEEVLKRHPKAFVKKSTSFFDAYQVREPKRWFGSRPIGNSHIFEDQAWASAYVNMCAKGAKNNLKKIS